MEALVKQDTEIAADNVVNICLSGQLPAGVLQVSTPGVLLPFPPLKG